MKRIIATIGVAVVLLTAESCAPPSGTGPTVTVSSDGSVDPVGYVTTGTPREVKNGARTEVPITSTRRIVTWKPLPNDVEVKADGRGFVAAGVTVHRRSRGQSRATAWFER